MRVAGHLLHPVQVRTGAKGRAVRGQHDGAHHVAASQPLEGARQFGDRRLVEGIAHIGAVQGHGGDIALDDQL